MKMGVKDKVREAIEPTVTELGYRIWDVTYQKLGADYHLEITIDSDEGINIDDCENMLSDKTDDADERIDLERAFEKLSSEERQIVTLHLNGGFKFREIAEIMNIPTGTALWRYRKAINKLRNILNGGE